MFDLLFRVIDCKIFIISLIIGLLYVYLSVPTPKLIYVYPTPDNIDNIEYVDIANNCYEFTKKEVNCDTNSKNIPIQTTFDDLSFD